MSFWDYLLYRMAKNWSSPMAKLVRELDAEPGTEADDLADAQRQFDWKVRNGMLREVTLLDVPEFGAGPGGSSCLTAVVVAASALIRGTGAIGAALAASLGWIVMGCVLWFFAQRRFVISYDWPTIGCFVLVACLCVGLSNIVRPMSPGVRLAGLIGVSLACPLLVFACLLRLRHERQRMLHLPTFAALHQASQD